MIRDFLDSDEPEAFVTGPAGSGKTTALKATVEILNELNINYLVTAYTHKAKNVLESKLPPGTPIKTLHSWLKKRPGINSKAKHIKNLMTNHQQGRPEHLQLLIVDEFSFINQEDYMSIGELQDELYLTNYECLKCARVVLDGEECKCGCKETKEVTIPPIKVLYVGDLNQLSPVKGWSAVTPIEPFWAKLTVVHRNTSELMKPLSKLVSMIEGKIAPAYLKANKDFVRQVDIDDTYLADKEIDKIMLAYTNKAVEAHNIRIQGYSVPKPGDIVYLPTLRCDKVFAEVFDTIPDGAELLTPNGLINKDTKYNPFKTLQQHSYIKYYLFEDNTIVPGIFGSYQNKIVRDKIGAALVAKNKANQDSIKEFKEYKCINDYVSIMDFNHCMTIHKSQGSEFTNVYVDSSDLTICKDLQEQMRLLYVSISRSKNKVFMNN